MQDARGAPLPGARTDIWNSREQVSSISPVESLIKMVHSQIFGFMGSTQITSAVHLHPWGDSDSAIHLLP